MGICFSNEEQAALKPAKRSFKRLGVQSWSPADVQDYLHELHLDQLVEKFAENGVSGQDLLTYSEADYIDYLGCTPLQVRKIQGNLPREKPRQAPQPTPRAPPNYPAPNYPPVSGPYPSVPMGSPVVPAAVPPPAFGAAPPPAGPPPPMATPPPVAVPFNGSMAPSMATPAPAAMPAPVAAAPPPVAVPFTGSVAPAGIAPAPVAAAPPPTVVPVVLPAPSPAVPVAVPAPAEPAAPAPAPVAAPPAAAPAAVLDKGSVATNEVSATQQLEREALDLRTKAAEAQQFAGTYGQATALLRQAEGKLQGAIRSLSVTTASTAIGMGRDIRVAAFGPPVGMGRRAMMRGPPMMNMIELATVRKADEAVKSAVDDITQARALIPSIPYIQEAALQGARRGVFVGILAPGIAGGMMQMAGVRKGLATVEQMFAQVQQSRDWVQRNASTFQSQANNLNAQAAAKQAQAAAAQAAAPPAAAPQPAAPQAGAPAYH